MTSPRRASMDARRGTASRAMAASEEAGIVPRPAGPTAGLDTLESMSLVIEVEGLRKHYGKVRAVECVEGLRVPDAGRIRLFGLDPVRDAGALQMRVGVQLQESHLQKRITVREAVDLWASLYRQPLDGVRLLEQLGLHEKRNAWFM